MKKFKEKENGDFNQYWYSSGTRERIVEELILQKWEKVAFLSTPSLFYSADLPDSFLFDFDLKFASPQFVHFDYRDLKSLPQNMEHSFEAAIIDPPFITEDVWNSYAKAVQILLKPDTGKVICTTVAENETLMIKLFNAHKTTFLPSIPNLVYQYNLYCNFTPLLLNQINPEIPS